MKINLTKAQYRDLMEAVLLGNWIRGLLNDQGLYENNNYGEIEDYLIKYAREFQCEELVEKFRDKEIISDNFSTKIESIMENYDDFNFWDNLSRRLGQRDFYESMSEQEKMEMNKNGNWFPDRIHKLYEDYEKEFEENGLASLRIEKK